MPRLTVAGHPLHAVISDWPVALLSSSPVFDALYLATGKKSYADAAHYTQVGGFFAGLLAGLAGMADYTTIPDRHRELKKNANMHAIINVGIIGVTAATIALRKRSETPSGKLPFLISALSGLGLIASAWYGGEMVYKHGMRVKGVSPVEDTPELKIPMIERMQKPLSDLAEVVAPPISTGGSSYQAELRH